MGRRGQGTLEVAGHISFKGREGGIGVGRVAALGASLRNACILKQERESTIELCEPDQEVICGSKQEQIA